MPQDVKTILAGTELRRRLTAYRKQNWKGIQTPEWQRRVIDSQLAADYGLSVQKMLQTFSLRSSVRWLDVGSGVGDWVLAARRFGIEAYGIEPDRIGVGSSDSSLAIAQARWGRDSIFVNGVAEHMPFGDDSFDVVTLNQVIEHVQDVGQSLSEGIRVLRTGGVLLLSAPNYLSCYEPHYRVIWLPLLPRPLARIYLRLIGRDPAFMDRIHYITRARLERTLKRLPCRFHDLDERHLLTLVANPDQVRRGSVRLMIGFIKRAGLLRFAIWLHLNLFNRGLTFAVTKSGIDGPNGSPGQ